MVFKTQVDSLATRIADEFNTVREEIALGGPPFQDVVVEAAEAFWFGDAPYVADVTALGASNFDASNFDGQLLVVITFVSGPVGTTGLDPRWTNILNDAAGYIDSWQQRLFVGDPTAEVSLGFGDGAAMMTVFAVSGAARATINDTAQNFQTNFRGAAIFGNDLVAGSTLLHQIVTSQTPRIFTPQAPFGAELALPGTPVSVPLGGGSGAFSTAAWTTELTATRNNQTVRPEDINNTASNFTMGWAVVLHPAPAPDHLTTDSSIDRLRDVNTIDNPPDTNSGLVWNGTQWVPGASPIPMADAAIIFTNGSGSPRQVSTGTNESRGLVNFDSVFDTGVGLTPTLSTGRITVTDAGWYAISGRVRMAGVTAGGSTILEAYVNGAPSLSETTGAHANAYVSGVVWLEAFAYVTLRLTTAQTGVGVYGSADGTLTFLKVAKLSTYGPAGPPGPTGPPGPAGVGVQGIQGLKGDKGDTGDAGADGIDGIDGIDGDDGAPGTGAILLEVNQTLPPPGTQIGTIVYRKLE